MTVSPAALTSQSLLPLAQLLSQKNSMTAEAENSRAHAQRQLYQLRSGRMDTAVLPPRTLLNEVQKMGPRAVHAGASLVEVDWLHNGA